MKNYSSLEDLSFISESALEISLAGFWDWNITTNEEYLSPRFKEMFGYADHEMENSPEAWQQIAFQEDLPQMFESFASHVASRGEKPFKSIVRFHHKNNSTVWVRCNGKVVSWATSGEPLRAVGCHIDITEEKELQKQLEKTIVERNFFLKEVHHRVKNNLQLLLSIARLKSKQGKVETHEMEDSISSISSAYEAIYQTGEVHSISIKNYLNQIIKPIIVGRNVDFSLRSVELINGIDFMIPIGLLITELVNNSLKHAFADVTNNKIWLEIENINNQLIINYRDNGKGFCSDVLAHIDSSKSFGLSIVQGLIEQLDGEIYFSNEQGASVEIKINCDQR